MTQIANAHDGTLIDTNSLSAIIVGTGRCGSTMLSNIFRTHPAVLSLSEFFAMLQPPLLHEEILDASAFWQILAAPNPRLRAVISPNITPQEILYPFEKSSRFTYETGVPPLLLVPLPHLTTDYEALFDELEAVVQDFPADRIAGHYARLFNWLKQRFGRTVSIERSGLSLPLLPELLELFPHTKCVHLIREGRGCLWSMYRHPGFRLAAFFEGGISIDVPEEDADKPFLPRVIATHIPFEAFGNVWTRTLVKGLQMLVQLPEERVLTVRYEDIVANPQHNIAQISDFIAPALRDEAWLVQASAIVKDPPAGWHHLSTAKQEELEKACQSGQALLDLLMQEGMYSRTFQTQLARLAEQYT